MPSLALTLCCGSTLADIGNRAVLESAMHPRTPFHHYHHHPAAAHTHTHTTPRIPCPPPTADAASRGCPNRCVHCCSRG